jgi:hypothetical protein
LHFLPLLSIFFKTRDLKYFSVCLGIELLGRQYNSHCAYSVRVDKRGSCGMNEAEEHVVVGEPQHGRSLAPDPMKLVMTAKIMTQL